MKNIIAIMTLFIIMFFNLAGANIEIGTVTPVPEIIACESQGTCEMTTLEQLLQVNQEELVDTQSIKHTNAQEKIVTN